MGTGSLATLLWLTLMMIACFVAVGLLHALRSVVMLRAGDWFYDHISDQLLPLVLAQAAGGVRGSQPLRDAGTIRQFIGGNGLTVFMDAPWSVVYIAVLFIVHASLGLLVTFGAVLLLALAWLSEAMMRKPSAEATAVHLRNMQELEAATRNAEVTEAMGMGDALSRRWKVVQQEATGLQAVAGGRSSAIQGFTKFVRLSLQVLVTCLAAWLALDGAVTTGAIIAASILASRALAPFENAIGSWKLLNDTKAAYKRLTETFAAAKGRGEAMSLPAPSGRISIERLVYGVAGRDQPILRNVSLALEPGEILGIIGPSGSGKSTLLRLLTGVYPPASGVVRLDGADVWRWTRADFGKYVGYLPQDVELFGGSVRDNIARFREDATPERIVQAAQMANAHELILRLPKGYDTEIGMGGALLSAGQRQRIGLARAFYGEPCLMVLDEPDANLDDTGQQALLSALSLAKQRCITTLVVTHRKSLLAHVDKLLVLRDGAVDMFGPAQQVAKELMARQNPKPKRVEISA